MAKKKPETKEKSDGLTKAFGLKRPAALTQAERTARFWWGPGKPNKHPFSGT